MDKNQFGKKTEGLKHKVGDAIEKVGKKISDMGATKIGQSIYNAGDKLEHAGDEETSNLNKPRP